MSMFARFDENPAMTLKQNVTDGRTHAQRENSIPTANKVCGGYKKQTNFVAIGALKVNGVFYKRLGIK